MSAHPPAPPHTAINWQRLAWSTLLVASLLLFFLPSGPFLPGLPVEAQMLILLSVCGLLLIALWAGLCLLALTHRQYLSYAWSILLVPGLFALALRLFFALQTAHTSTWLQSHLLVLAGVWGLAVAAATPIVLAIYLWQVDHSVHIAAFTFPSIVWLYLLFTRLRGPEQILQDAFVGRFPAEFTSLVCFGFWVVVLVPFFFFGHFFRLLQRERRGADMILDTPNASKELPS